ncbi:MAG: C4-dicarboxylate transporter permease [Sporomusa sp.]|jgi:C4-dicarboxylate transporter DctM subunit|nr:C4-dicarboxylate transporter permease [Sporomusa sp.]
MLFFILFFVFLIIGVPIAFSMSVSGLIFFSINNIPLNTVPQKILGGMDSFVLLAIPLFIFAGELMEGGGISRRVLNLASTLVGHIRGGLGHVVVVATLIMSGISGSSSADTAAIGSAMIPTMVRKGYDRAKAVSIVAAAGGMDILVPPCIAMIILGGVVNLSVANLFFAGILPGILMGLGIMSVIYVQAKKANIPLEIWKGFGEVWKAFIDSAWALLIPVFLLGGIKVGAFTATEGAVFVVVYSLWVAIYIYKEITWRDVIPIMLRSVRMTGAIMFLIGVSTLFGWVTAREQIPDMLMGWIATVSDSPWIFLAISNIVLLISGSILEGAPAIIILAPLLIPMALKLGIDPIHFGTMMITNLGVGYVLPPIGICLLIACTTGQIDVAHVVKHVMPYFLIMVVILLLITYVPAISLFIPKLAGYQPVGNW